MQIIDKPANDFWENVATNCTEATFFHTPIWRNIVIQTYPEFSDASIGFDWGEKQAVVPLIKKSVKGVAQSKRSTFASCYGGPISTSPLTDDDHSQIWKEIWSGRTLKVQISGNPIAHKSFIDANDASEIDFTHILNLDAPFEELFSRFSKGHRSSAKKGKRMGVTTSIASSIEEYEVYFQAYQDSIRRWGDRATSDHSWELFKTVFEQSQLQPENIKLWLAHAEGEIIAGALVFYWNQHVDWWHGASFEKYFSYCANNVLQHDIIKHAVENGYTFYDFNPSGGHAGVEKFKKSFNAQKVEFARYAEEANLVKWVRPLVQAK